MTWTFCSTVQKVTIDTVNLTDVTNPTNFAQKIEILTKNGHFDRKNHFLFFFTTAYFLLGQLDIIVKRRNL